MIARNQKAVFLNKESYYTHGNIILLNRIEYFNFDNKLSVFEYHNLVCQKQDCNKVFINYQNRMEVVNIVEGG